MYFARRTFSKTFRSTLFFGLMATSTSISAEILRSARESATVIELNTDLRAVGSDAMPVQCYKAYVDLPGNLSINVSVLGPSPVEPRLDFFSQASTGPPLIGPSFTYIERYAGSMWLEIRAPGTYLFCVAAQDPLFRLDEYKLTNSFVSGLGLKNGDPDEEEPDPYSRPVASGEAPIATDARLWDRRLYGVLALMCRSGEVDDHGDTVACATTLDPGDALTGEIWNDWGDDQDFFAFRLTELQTVEIATTGWTDTFGSLYDRSGHRLATDDDGGSGDNFRIAKTLTPGWYYVRIEGRQRSEGAYALSVNASGLQ